MQPRQPNTPNSQVPGDEVPARVLESLRRGEASALQEIYTLHGERVFNVCLGILGNANDAEDATQEVFLRAFKQARKFSARGSFCAWLLRLAANHTLNVAKASTRRQRRSEPLPPDATSDRPSAEQNALRRELQDEMRCLIQKLPIEQRQVLVLRELEGLSYTELATALQLPLGTITSRLIRGRAKLRELIEKFGSDCLDLG